MADTEPSDYNRRARAAWAFAGITYDELATRTGIKVDTLRGYLRRAKPNVPDLKALLAIGDACGVPAAFMQHGFAVAGASPEDIRTAQRLRAIEDRMAEYGMWMQLETDKGSRFINTVSEVAEVAIASVEQQRTAALQAPEGELGRDLSGDGPSDQSQPQSDSPEAPDAPSGTDG